MIFRNDGGRIKIMSLLKCVLQELLLEGHKSCWIKDVTAFGEFGGENKKEAWSDTLYAV